jgi:hypothetical protein
MNTVQDDAVVAGASGTQAVVAAADGRTLTIAECGDPDGFPVFFLHGTPGSRFAGQGFASAYASVERAWSPTTGPATAARIASAADEWWTASLTFPQSQTASVSSGSP